MKTTEMEEAHRPQQIQKSKNPKVFHTSPGPGPGQKKQNNKKNEKTQKRKSKK